MIYGIRLLQSFLLPNSTFYTCLNNETQLDAFLKDGDNYGSTKCKFETQLYAHIFYCFPKEYLK